MGEGHETPESNEGSSGGGNQDSDQRNGGGKVSPGCCGEARAVMQSAKQEGSLRFPGDCEGGQEKGAGM